MAQPGLAQSPHEVNVRIPGETQSLNRQALGYNICPDSRCTSPRRFRPQANRALLPSICWNTAGRNEVAARVRGWEGTPNHRSFAIAALEISATNLPTVILGNSDKIELGQTVLAIGNALGLFTNTVSKGIVSGLGRKISAAMGQGGEMEH